MSPRGSLVAGASLGALAVAFGAFGAHALRDVLQGPAAQWYATAVEYHGRHALALLACGLLGALAGPGRAIRVAGACLLGGTVVFSGTLYLMAFTGVRWLGAITPIGGVLLMAGWVALACSASRAIVPRPNA